MLKVQRDLGGQPYIEWSQGGGKGYKRVWIQRRSIVLILFSLLLLIGSCQQSDNRGQLNRSSTKQSEPPISYPSEQANFHIMNSEYPLQYNQGINEIQKSAVFNKCNASRKDYLAKYNFSCTNWVGRIKAISTDQGGDVAYLRIISECEGFKIAYQTWNNRLSDLFDNTMLKKGSKTYNQVASLKVGDLVRFSGKFLPDPERGIRESSLTEQGCVDFPEFIIRFSDIKPY